ncbi:hypothetical protein [Spongiimicrobium salis]|uniref:hypothetical protein n=1 Tax=Spongiimicrobium salis TaxID=1667022 RepID=UPI00374DD22C
MDQGDLRLKVGIAFIYPSGELDDVLSKKNEKVNKKNLSTSGNIVVPSYKTLVEEGSRVTLQEGIWIAESDTWILKAEGPLEFLGLANLIKKKGEHWKATDNEIDGFLKKFNQDNY